VLESDTDRLEMIKALGEQVYIDSCLTWCVFESPFYEFELDRELEGASYSALVRTSDASDVARGSEVLRGAVTYTVSGIEPDGEGMTRLRLSE
jgi:hypothetical protein